MLVFMRWESGHFVHSMPFHGLSICLSIRLSIHPSVYIIPCHFIRLSGDNPLADSIIVESEVEEDEARRFLEDIRANYPEVRMPCIPSYWFIHRCRLFI